MGQPRQAWYAPRASSRLVWTLIFAACICANIAVASPAKMPPTDIPVRKVVLFSSGVGYFEHLGVVTGSGSTELHFQADQINDLLKSLVLQDLDGGEVGTVIYPTQEPLAKTLRSFQVDLSTNPSLAELLTQVRGSPVRVTIQAEQLSGTILGLEKKLRVVEQTDQVVEAWLLNLVTDSGIRSVPLADLQRLELEEAQLQEELQKALSALTQARGQVKKPVVITFKGEGEHRVRVGYIIETPLWKTSYRLLLPTSPVEQGKIQGWAIVENLTDNDWQDVQLSLVSGRPISFVQDLYGPLYVSRPVVKPELYAGLRPQMYESGSEHRAVQAAEQPSPAPPPPPRARALSSASSTTLPGEKAPRDPSGSDRELPIDPLSSVVAAAASESVGELFQYSITNVSLPRQRSAMIPILTDDIAVERLSIYNQALLPHHPLNGVRVKNNTGKHLLQGPVTVLADHSYGGDARLDNLPPGQERLLSYAIDLQVHVKATQQQQDSTIQTGKLIKGVLQLTRKNVFSQEYTIENRAEGDKVLIIEHPIRKGWTLVDSPKPIEVTETLYRFRQVIPARKPTVFAVKEEIVLGETIAILPSDLGQLEFYSRVGEIPQNVRDGLLKAIGLKQVLVETERQIKEHKQQLQDITHEQKRIRENMSTISATSQYYTRLLSKLNEQETLIERLSGEIERLKNVSEHQRRELETYLSNTTL